MSITIREARPGDLDVIVRFNIALASESEGIRLEPRTIEAGVRAALADPAKGRYYLAEVDEPADGRRGVEPTGEPDRRTVGQLMTTFEWSDWRNGMFLWIQSVYVERDWRRRGVFRALYRHVERLSRGPGMCGLRLYVHDHNRAARDTYRRLGMVPPGYSVLETPDALRDPAEEAGA